LTHGINVAIDEDNKITVVVGLFLTAADTVDCGCSKSIPAQRQKAKNKLTVRLKIFISESSLFINIL
jgi:hypothetical protein